ncbi:MAG: RidA family protein [Planctomycetota bacterium]
MPRDTSSRQVIASSRAPAAIGPYSQAVLADGWLFCSGQIALDPASGELERGGVEAETRRVLDNLEAVLAAAGLGRGDVVKTTLYLGDLEDFARVNAVYAERFAASPPARATVEVSALPKGARVEIDCVARKRG